MKTNIPEQYWYDTDWRTNDGRVGMLACAEIQPNTVNNGGRGRRFESEHDSEMNMQ